MHRFLDINSEGFADRGQWVRMIGSANPEGLLKSRGLSPSGAEADTSNSAANSVALEKPNLTVNVQSAIDTVAA
ncbi:MAG: hypothetical protein ACPIOQ_13575, partial [Promethearchaeia archaeon]